MHNCVGWIKQKNRALKLPQECNIKINVKINKHPVLNAEHKPSQC